MRKNIFIGIILCFCAECNYSNSFTGGMEELSLDQIKKKSELEEDIDFEKGDFDLECCEIMVTLNVN